MKTKNQWNAGVISIANKKKSSECQDSNHLIVKSDILILAIADGAGSAIHGKKGAEIATRTATNTMLEYVDELNSLDNIKENNHNWKEKIYNAATLAKKEINLIAKKEENKINKYATTFILIFAYSGKIYVFQIGDGAVIGKYNSGEITSLTSPEIGDYYNMTDFLTTEKSISRAKFKCTSKPISALSAFTDGIQALALSPPDKESEIWKPFLPFFKPLFSFIENCDEKEQIKLSIKKFLTSDKMIRSTEDDLTLFLAALNKK